MNNGIVKWFDRHEEFGHWEKGYDEEIWQALTEQHELFRVSPDLARLNEVGEAYRALYVMERAVVAHSELSNSPAAFSEHLVREACGNADSRREFFLERRTRALNHLEKKYGISTVALEALLELVLKASPKYFLACRLAMYRSEIWNSANHDLGLD